MSILKIYTAPTSEPVSMADLKIHLKVDSGTFDGNLTLTQSLAYGSHAIADNYTTHVGTGISVLGKQAEVLLHCGTNGATGTNDTKIQESDDNTTYADWTGGAFTQVTTANDNVDYKKAYTGTKAYIRTVSKVLLAACEFGTSVLVNAATSAEDDFLEDILQASREHVEDITGRALLTQTWDYLLDEFPDGDYIKLPFGNLQSVTSITYKGEAGTTTTLTENTDYLVEANGEACGRIVLPPDVSWPSDTLWPSNPITIRFICGWTAAASIPKKIVQAIKMFCTDLYSNRESQVLNTANLSFVENKTAMNLLWSNRLYDEDFL